MQVYLEFVFCQDGNLGDGYQCPAAEIFFLAAPSIAMELYVPAHFA
jgi:hypothetical protein